MSSMGYCVLACGSNGSYQLGIDNDDDHNQLQTCCFQLADGSIVTELSSKPVKIVCGGNHSFVLLESHQLFACGDNTHGQCGIAPNEESHHLTIFHQVEGSNWIDVAAGWEYSILVDDADQLYACGSGPKGELGLSRVASSPHLTKLDVDLASRIVKIKACVNHTVLQLANGDLYGWGNCRKGQLGTVTTTKPNGKPVAVLDTPTKLSFAETITLPILDWDVGSDRTFILDSSNTIHIRGKAQDSVKLENEIVALKAMWSSVHYSYFSHNNILTVGSHGNNSHGQLFPQRELQPHFNSNQETITSFEIGSEHGLVVTSDGSVYSWGWGEHGNCGVHAKPVSDSLDEQVTFDYLNKIYDGSENNKVVALGCGCATSWLVVTSSQNYSK